MPTKRQRIVSKIVTAVQGISTDAGFETNLGENVFDWETDFQEDELPATSVCDLTAEYLENLSDEHIDFFKLPLQIRTTLKADSRAEDARKIEADILKSLKQFENFIVDDDGKIGSDLQVKKTGFVLAEDAFTVVAVAVEIELTFNTERFNAYQ